MQAAALVRLWGTGHVEHVEPPPAPFHILAQQIMALSLQFGGIARQDWIRQVGNVPGFRSMEPDHVATVLAHMVATGILHDDHGVLWIGRRGEEEYGRGVVPMLDK
jgi:ATP-dependent helicase Lhr and Lhr-like helicase